MRLRDAILAILGIAVMAAAGQDARLSLPGPEEQQASELRQSGDKDLDQEEVVRSQLPALPVWSPSDYEKVKSGEIVAGENFFNPLPVDPDATIEPPVADLPEPVEEPQEPEKDETTISPEDLAAYFAEIPSNERGEQGFLTDPQELLSRQEFRDRQSFLDYHSSESNIDIFVYLFDDRQEFPADISIGTVYEDLFSIHGPVALVFYHLGAPDRSQLFMSPEISAVISQDQQDRTLRAAIVEALEKSDAAYQLDNFLVELSTRLYWVERELSLVAVSNEIQGVEQKDGEVEVKGASEAESLRLVIRATLLLGSIAFIGFAGWAGWIWWQNRRRYRFPEVESSELLGAPHAAGVGAVLSFGNSQLSPSKQRDQAPDYLQRM